MRSASTISAGQTRLNSHEPVDAHRRTLSRPARSARQKQTGIARKTAIVPDPPHEVRQHYAVFEHWHSGFPIYSITQMVFGDSQSAEAQEYDPNAPALDELTPQQTAKRAVLYIPGGDFSDYMPTAAWRFVTDLVDAGLRVDIPSPVGCRTTPPGKPCRWYAGPTRIS